MSFAPQPITLQKKFGNDSAPGSVLYVTEDSRWGKIGYEKVAAAFSLVKPVFWSPSMPKPDLRGWHGDWIISFKSDLILPREILNRAKKGSINFHPSPPKYRGLGGYWWALHNRDETFGATCHLMDERIDHGEIIATEVFPIFTGETVETLKQRAATHCLTLLKKVLADILSAKPLMPCGVKWEKHLYTSKELYLAQIIHAANSNSHQGHLELNSDTTKQALETLKVIRNVIMDADKSELHSSNNKSTNLSI